MLPQEMRVSLNGAPMPHTLEQTSKYLMNHQKLEVYLPHTQSSIVTW